MINCEGTKQYCCEDISKIENFELASSDETQMWDIHHRNEITENKTRKDLIADGKYYNVPASELIFLTRSEHMKLHSNNRSGELKNKIREAIKGAGNGMFGKHHSEEAKLKISETRKTKIQAGEITYTNSTYHTKEGNVKISEKAKERYKDKKNHPMFGRHQSEETKRKISLAKKGRIPWNKGKKINPVN